ncbi:MAG: GIY-YIG nuclease family protein [Leptolyngbyaceae bacterium]|nr:GIY-YIG nuclease family protein [Leptolyngbyaceae bacterium]
MIIYKATNLVNGKVYIGQTVQELKKRRQQHKQCKSTAIGAAIRKYGLDKFEFIEIERCSSLDHLNEQEIFWIRFYGCISPNGYNLVSGGAKRTEISEESRERYRKINLGRVRSEETKRKISDSKKGWKPTSEMKEKQKVALKKRYSEKQHHMAGKKLSEEHRLAISIGHKRGGKMLGNKNGAANHRGAMSEETKRKISETKKEKWQDENFRLKMSLAQKNRKPITEETRLKRSISMKETLKRKRELT